jgi:hypothetical protein
LITLRACCAGTTEPPLVIRALGITESDGQVWSVNITVGNPSQAALSGIEVAVLPSGVESWEIPTLAPGEWTNRTIALSVGNYRSLAARASYTANHQTNALAEAVQMREPEKSWWTAIASAAAPVALGASIGLFGGLLGAWVTSAFNLKKERIAAQLQWSRALVERYEVPYRSFLSNCSGMVDAQALRQEFTQLDATALVPDRIREMIAAGIQAVETESDGAAKRQKRDGFLRQIREQLLEPFPK